MSWQKILVKFRLAAATAILFCYGEAMDTERPAKGIRESTSLVQRGTFRQVFLPSTHSTVALPYGQLEFGGGTTQDTHQTHLVPSVLGEGKMVPARAWSQLVSQAKRKATAISTVAPGHATLLTDQALVAQTTFMQSELLRGETQIPSDTETTRTALNIASKPELPNRQKIAPVLPAVMEGNVEEAASYVSDKRHITWLRNQRINSTATQRINSTASHNFAAIVDKSATLGPTTAAGPTLAPKPSPAATGVYHVLNGTADCVKVVIGLTMIVKNRKTNRLEYFNINPNVTNTTGYCGIWLSTLKISFHAGFIRFSFFKSEDVYYLSVIEASLTLADGSLYGGIKGDNFISAPIGNCFKCLSKQTIVMADGFQLQIINSQLQAFDIVDNQFGKEKECIPDMNKRFIPIGLSLSILGLIVILFVTGVIYRRNTNRGYEEI